MGNGNDKHKKIIDPGLWGSVATDPYNTTGNAWESTISGGVIRVW